MTSPHAIDRRIRDNQPAFALAGLAMLAIGTRLAANLNLPMPFCALRKLTGIPCPACGSTRSLMAWVDLDPLRAFTFNPLFFAATLAVALWAAVWLAEKCLGRSWLPRWEERVKQLPLTRIVIALAALNWLYLCLTLPK